MDQKWNQFVNDPHHVLWIVLCISSLGFAYALSPKGLSGKIVVLQGVLASIFAVSYDLLKPAIGAVPSWSMAVGIVALCVSAAKVNVGEEEDAAVTPGRGFADKSATLELDELLSGLRLSVSNCWNPQIRLVGVRPRPNSYVKVQNLDENKKAVRRVQLGRDEFAGSLTKRTRKTAKKPSKTNREKAIKSVVKPPPANDPPPRPTDERDFYQEDNVPADAVSHPHAPNANLVQQVRSSVNKIAFPPKLKRIFVRPDTEDEKLQQRDRKTPINHYGKLNATDCADEAEDGARRVIHLKPKVDERTAAAAAAAAEAEGVMVGRKSLSPFELSPAAQKDVSVNHKKADLMFCNKVVDFVLDPAARVTPNFSPVKYRPVLLRQEDLLNDTHESWVESTRPTLSMADLREAPPHTLNLSKKFNSDFANSTVVKAVTGAPPTKFFVLGRRDVCEGAQEDNGGGDSVGDGDGDGDSDSDGDGDRSFLRATLVKLISKLHGGDENGEEEEEEDVVDVTNATMDPEPVPVRNVDLANATKSKKRLAGGGGGGGGSSGSSSRKERASDSTDAAAVLKRVQPTTSRRTARVKSGGGGGGSGRRPVICGQRPFGPVIFSKTSTAPVCGTAYDASWSSLTTTTTGMRRSRRFLVFLLFLSLFVVAFSQVVTQMGLDGEESGATVIKSFGDTVSPLFSNCLMSVAERPWDDVEYVVAKAEGKKLIDWAPILEKNQVVAFFLVALTMTWHFYMMAAPSAAVGF